MKLFYPQTARISHNKDTAAAEIKKARATAGF
jgi:hypothetical protein